MMTWAERTNVGPKLGIGHRGKATTSA
jgi:hypothetical protein